MGSPEKHSHLEVPDPELYLKLGKYTERYLKGVRRMSVSGTENLPSGDEPYLLAFKHMSNWDSLAVGKAMLDYDGTQLFFVTKKETTDSRVTGDIVTRGGAIRFDRDHPMSKQPEARERIRGLLAEGAVPAMAPEGTRTPGPEIVIPRNKRGLGMLAVESSVGIATVGIHGTRGFLQSLGKRIHLHFGAMSYPGQYEDDTQKRRVITRLERDYITSLQEATYEAYRRGGGGHLVPKLTTYIQDHAHEGGL